MTAPVKWALAAGVLALALIVALLPREDATAPPEAAAAKPDLAAARAEAALSPCPPSQPDAPAASTLAGAAATCLADGAPVDVGALLGGEPTLINVWATWCEPCRGELPVLQAYAERPGATRVLTVQVASGAADGLELLAALGVRLPTVHDGDGQGGAVRTALRMPPNLPASYLVTPDGAAKLISDPRVFTDPAQVEKAVHAIMAPA